ncbi:hypothetical protein DEQ92_10335 [Haloferax sp. Atlit-6N]|uniref:hypothetical protein n=1 Tax=Haloferax sp. Atlit-6N TaxID=2077205 RepID=UPI000E241D2A|nr:hypothetical protein [Haloferax sp. Atlit-6N]REA03486.1 hypothetical protein DEQ92_10160 [Haloferax sp. Atlit-6N]REA03514.1 hypothetical protein DEQ92_10335 [Haloferax sp. Atlit-6N]
MTNAIVTFTAIAVVGVFAIATFGTSYIESAEAQATTEGISLDDAGRLVEASDIAVDFGANVTVTHNGSTLTEGVDYRFNESTGELERLENATVSNGTQVNISYQFEAPDQTTRDVNRGLGAISIPVPLLALIAAVFVIWGFLG